MNLTLLDQSSLQPLQIQVHFEVNKYRYSLTKQLHNGSYTPSKYTHIIYVTDERGIF